jgi:shikimate dehydrogenase
MVITGATQITGVIGDPISHTRSPAMHNAAFAALGLDWVYVPFHVSAENLKGAVEGFRATGVRGINATVPHKPALLELVDGMTDEASFIGAINTLTFEPDGRVLGENTDARGFIAAMDDHGVSAPAGEKVVVLGAGGAARAVVAALGGAGVSEIVIVNRTEARAESLAARARDRMGVTARSGPLTPEALREALTDASMLVNTTSGGMHGATPLQVDGSLLTPPLVVYDIVYSPPETDLLRAASANGCNTLNGLSMLVHQAAIAFESWTGEPAPVDVMRDALVASL